MVITTMAEVLYAGMCTIMICLAFGNYAHVDCYRDDMTCLSTYFERIIHSLNWSSVVLLHDADHEVRLPLPMTYQRYAIDDLDNKDILKCIYKSMFPNLNLLIAANISRTLQIVKEIDQFDGINRTTDFRHNSKLIVMLDQQYLSAIENTIHHLDNVAVMAIDTIHKCCSGKLRLYTLYNHPGRKILSPVPAYSSKGDVVRIFPNSQYGYNNRHVIVSSLQSPPYIIKKMINGTIRFDGYIMDVWKIIAKTLNVSYHVVETADGHWGGTVNGSWIGMVGQLVRREVDIVAADLTITHQRSEVIDFVYPIVKADSMDIIYRKKPATGKAFFLLIGPLRTEVYVVFLAVFVATVIVFALLESCGRFSGKFILSRRCWSCLRRAKWDSWEFVGSLLKQGFQRIPRTDAGRVVLTAWWILAMVITSVYSANLIASLSSPPGKITLSSIDELTDSDYTMGMVTVGTSFDTMKRSKRPEIQRLLAKMMRDNETNPVIFSKDRNIQMASVLQGTHAHLLYRALAARYMSQDCLLALIGEPVTWAEERLSFGLSKDSPLKGDLNIIMYKMAESGVLDTLWKKWTTARNSTVCAVDRNVDAITLREVGGGFLVVCGGIGLSLSALLVEVWWRFQSRHL